jgi:hypothetical protein
VGRPDFNDRINQIVEGAEEAFASAEVDPEDIRITPPKEPEVNPVVYRDVESLLFRGFLILPGEINGVQFVFKSINHHEFDHLQWASGLWVGGKSIERYYSMFISYGVFMVDGQNILPERDRWVPEIVEMFLGLSPEARSKIINYLSEVNQKASGAVTLTEAYQMELNSRFRWAQHKGLDLSSPMCTGVEGSDKLGLNYAQLVWRALNYYDDLRESAEREWDNAKFIGSCFAGKEIRKIYNQDKDRRQKEREERVKRRDQLIRQVVLRESPEETEKKGRYVMNVARSVEELAGQLEKDLRGEKDWHDEVVAKEEERIRRQIQERQQKLQGLVQEKQHETSLPYMANTNLVGLTAAEVQERITRRRQLEAQNVASRMVYPEMMDERMGQFIEKYVGAEDSTYQSAGVRLEVGTTDRDPSGVHPLPPPRPRATPFRR